MRRYALSIGRFIGVVMTIWLIPAVSLAQAPYAPPPTAPQAPGMPPGQPAYPPNAPVQTQPAPGVPVQPQQIPQQQDQHLEYAFRPDLTNPEFGMCLNLEKQWKDMWQRYYQLYSQIRTMNPNDPQYAQVTYYARMLKSQLDAAWNDFSSKCVYFPKR
jgi:hypothetical protein